jgi:hypothetical protein
MGKKERKKGKRLTLNQLTGIPSNTTDALYNSKMITRKIANNAIKTAISGVVPHPGATFPYSEFNGFKILPTLVCLPLLLEVSLIIWVAIKIIIY